MRRFFLFVLLTHAAGATAQSQTRDDLVTAGRAHMGTQPAEALRSFERALELDSLDYEVNWRAAIAAVELGQETPDSIRSPERDSLYVLAERYARRAVALDTTDVNGFFALAMALGRTALTKGKREQLRYAVDLHAAASRALALAPRHDGVHHVLGLWNAEVMRTSGFNRFMAKNILGAKVMGQASWARAIEHLERAVELDPTRIYHRLDLARVYANRKRYVAAREQLLAIPGLPDRVRLDPRYRDEAAALLERIASRAEEEERKAAARTGEPNRAPKPDSAATR